MQLRQTSPQQPQKKLAIAFCRDRPFRISSRWYSRLASARQGGSTRAGAREKVLLERHRAQVKVTGRSLRFFMAMLAELRKRMSMRQSIVSSTALTRLYWGDGLPTPSAARMRSRFSEVSALSCQRLWSSINSSTVAA